MGAAFGSRYSRHPESLPVTPLTIAFRNCPIVAKQKFQSAYAAQRYSDCCAAFLYNENHAIVAWFKKAIAYKENANKKSEKNVFVSKAPSERDLAPKATEGECEMSMGQLQ